MKSRKRKIADMFTIVQTAFYLKYSFHTLNQWFLNNTFTREGFVLARQQLHAGNNIRV